MNNPETIAATTAPEDWQAQTVGWREWALLAVFIASGFAGLIYQSIWSHYLGLTLGHAAYAQTLVLAIFMGGMAAGAALTGRYTPHWRDLVRAYALVEGVIGALGLMFHPGFVAYLGWTQDTLLPALDSAPLATVWQWLSGASLLLPQSILLGATFPLLSAGLLRRSPGGDGRVLGGLYFANSLGAAGGALTSTFLLLPAVGMPGTVMTAALINIVVAIVAWGLAGGSVAGVTPKLRSAMAVARDHGDTSLPRLTRILLVATFLSGAFSFVYEIGWVRMLNQALGTTIHSFELMLAAFIAGLAFGGLWIRQRGARIADAIRYAGYAQVAMGIAAALSLPAFAHSFAWMGWLMTGLARTDSGYVMFNLGGATISLVVMFPAAFFAGMTLPLFTMALLRTGADERAIARIYAANTLGAIVGVFAMVHLLVPALGVHLAVLFAALGDALLGLYLLRRVRPGYVTTGYVLAAAGALVAVIIGLVLGRVDPMVQASGVFRHGQPRLRDVSVLYLRDGKTSTVSVHAGRSTGLASIATNGKPDAALQMLDGRAPSLDESTMILAGALPLALHADPQRVAVIGWGSGLTVHTLLGSERPKVVDAIEIERAMYEGARLFGKRVARAYTDPRVRLHVDDARTFLSTGARRYDVIVSEPSNPWVSGVASLFTREFYRIARRHLDVDGLLVQWVQSYEIDDGLLATMVAALLAEFPYVDLYLSNQSDLLMVASGAPIGAVQWNRLMTGPVRADLERIGIRSADELAIRRIGSQRIARAFVRMSGAQEHSDFFPLVSLLAPRSRFRDDRAIGLQSLIEDGMPVLDMIEGRQIARRGTFSPAPYNLFVSSQSGAAEIAASIRRGVPTANLARESSGYAVHVAALLQLGRRGIEDADLPLWSDVLAMLAGGTLGLLAPEDQQGLWIEPSWMVHADQLPAKAKELLAAFSAAAARDAAAMRVHAVAALEASKGVLAERAREQLLLIAQLGAIGEGDPNGVVAIDEKYGRDVSPVSLGFDRAFLLAWSREQIEAQSKARAPAD